MKKLFALLMVLAMLSASACAEQFAVQIIGGDSAASQTVSLDDVQLEQTVEIPGFGDITPTAFEQQDCLMLRNAGQLGKIWIWTGSGKHKPDGYDQSFAFNLKIECAEHGDEKYPWWCEEWVSHYESKTQADFACLFMDVLNTTPDTVDFLKDCTVKVVFDDSIEYAGWCYQRDLDLNRCTWIDSSDNFPIEPYYEGHYVFGCTLPNAMFESDAPLSMIITLGGNEITYNIRK